MELTALTTLYAWLLSSLAVEGDRSISLVTILIVLGIIALVIWIALMLIRRRG